MIMRCVEGNGDFSLPEALVGEDKGVTYTRRVVTVVVVVVVTVSSVERILSSLSDQEIR